MQMIDIKQTGPGAYEVAVTQAGDTTRHDVKVPPELRDDLAVAPDDEERLVRESFEFLLEREPASAILATFDLDVISRYFPEYWTEIQHRLG